MKKYKLTDQNMRTYKGFQWELGEEKRTTIFYSHLCSSSWLHYYHHPLLAILLNPLHGNIKNPRLFEVKALGKHLNDKGLKGGCTKMTLVKELTIPRITITQRTAFSILCALEVYTNINFITWANNWLNNVDRSANAAYAAADYAATTYATNAAAAAAANAADAADAAANATNAATYATKATTYATNAADAAANATNAAANAAPINFIKLAKKCLKY